MILDPHAMRTPLLLLTFVVAALPASAQLTNGSFEQNGQGSLDGWNNSCTQAVLLPGGAPGCGDQHAGYPMGTWDAGCNSSFDAFYGSLSGSWTADQTLTIGFWSRTPMDFDPDHYMAIECRLSCLVNGVFSPTLNSGTAVEPSTDWTYHIVEAVTDPWQVAHAPLVLGFVGHDTTSMRLMEIDGVEILSVSELTTGSITVDPVRILGYYDPTDDAIVVSRSMQAPLIVVDASGRTVCVRPTSGTSGAQRFSTADLAPGMYTAISGARYVRFVKR